MKSLDDYTTLGAIVLVLIVFVAFNIWWLPQKWQGCQKLYDKAPAQVVCFLSK
jgi:hypothetical protein